MLELRADGAQAEAEERWADAVSLYQDALEIDALMLFATEGVARAEPRADLDTRLENIPKERDRLIDARIMRLAQETLAEAEAIADRGPRLQGQIAAAQDTLSYASTPVAVTMMSDGLTDITLLRVKRLGTLAEQTLSLRPGVHRRGMRNGYRDVRVKFEVRPRPNECGRGTLCRDDLSQPMSDRDTDTGTPDTLTPDAFSPATASQGGEQLAATAFEPLSQSSQQKKRLNVTQIALGVVGVLIAALLFFLHRPLAHPQY